MKPSGPTAPVSPSGAILRSRWGKPSPRVNPAKKNIIAIVLMAGGLLLVAALMADLRTMKQRKPRGYVDPGTELQEIVLGLNGTRYEDASGLFSIVPPAGWMVFKPPDSRPYNVIFRGPSGATMSIMATRVEYNDLPSLMHEIEASEQQAGIRTQTEALFFLGGPAVRRTAGLLASRVFSVDFVRDRVAHHIICGTPPELFDRYVPVLMDVLGTYRAGPPASAPAAADE
jgi:hypothetical protein